MRTFFSHSSVRFALTSLDVLGLALFIATFYLVLLGGPLFYLAVWEGLTVLNSGSFFFLFKFKK